MRESFLEHLLKVHGSAPKEEPYPGQWVRFDSPGGRRGNKACSAKLMGDGLTGVSLDHRLGMKAVWHAESRTEMTPAARKARAAQIRAAIKAAQEEEEATWAQRAEINAELWAEAHPLEKGDPVDLYLRSRGFDLSTFPGSLRMHPDLDYYYDDGSTGGFPAMLAAVRQLSGEMVTIHRTYLTTKGRKANVPQPRKLMSKSGPLQGAAIWLGGRKRFQEGGVIGIAEGIETAMACRLSSNVPTASAISAGLLKQFQWPPATKELFIFADNDESGVGQAAGEELASRAVRSGLKVRLLIPEAPGTDWADVYANAKEEA